MIAHLNEHFCYKLDYSPPPLTYFCLTWIRPWADMAETSYCMYKASYAHFIPTKFRKYPSIGSVGKDDYVFPYIYMH